MAFPNLPGVPKLLPTGQNLARAGFGVIAATGWRIASGRQVWGIFKESQSAAGETKLEPLFISDKFQSLPSSLESAARNLASTLGLREEPSFNGFEFSKDYRVSNFPTENGGFASYNKVEMPGVGVVTFCMGGSESERKRFLDTIDAASGSTDLYSIVTPAAKYINYNIGRYGYSRRSESGAQLLIVSVEVNQIRPVTSVRQTGKPKKIISAKQAPGNSPIDSGKAQASAPNKSVLKKMSEGLLKGAVDLFNFAKSGVSRFSNGAN